MTTPSPAPQPGSARRRGRIRVGLSTSSVFPEGTEQAFALAAALGYDGVELMVTADRLTQDAARLRELVAEYDVPVLSVHSPCLAISARVWGTDALGKLERSIELAVAVGAEAVVAHPPFRWQRATAATFPEAVVPLAEAAASLGVHVAIENMYPLKVLGVPVSAYAPDWDVVATGYPGYTLDVSHTAVAGVDALEMARQMGSALAHVHLADGTGAGRDEHLVPGRGIARCAEVLHSLADGSYADGAATRADGSYADGAATRADGDHSPRTGAAPYGGSVVLEVSTRTLSPEQRTADLAEAFAFARTHLAAASPQP